MAHPGQHLRRSLRPGDGPAVHAAAKVRHFLGVLADDVPPGPALPVAYADLPEAGAAVKGQVLRLIKGGSGGPGPVEVAGVDGVDGDVREAPLQGPDLPPAPVRKVAVVLALGNAVEVALRLGVADEIEIGHNKASCNQTVFP